MKLDHNLRIVRKMAEIYRRGDSTMSIPVALSRASLALDIYKDAEAEVMFDDMNKELDNAR